MSWNYFFDFFPFSYVRQQTMPSRFQAMRLSNLLINLLSLTFPVKTLNSLNSLTPDTTNVETDDWRQLYTFSLKMTSRNKRWTVVSEENFTPTPEVVESRTRTLIVLMIVTI